MPVRITAKHRYAQGTQAVLATFTDAGEIKAKQKALGARKTRVRECKRTSQGMRVRFVRELPAAVPGVLKRFIQPWNSVEQSETWREIGDDGFAADLAINIANVPVDVSGTLQLKPTGDGCVNVVRIDVSSAIPFLGKTLAQFVAADCKRLVAKEYDYIKQHLA